MRWVGVAYGDHSDVLPARRFSLAFKGPVQRPPKKQCEVKIKRGNWAPFINARIIIENRRYGTCTSAVAQLTGSEN